MTQIKYLKFEIIDTGPGIASEELPQVFEAFVQTATGRQASEGTGLGLPSSRKFVQLMGGDMTVQSVDDQGTTFGFTPPCELSATVVEPPAPIARRVVAFDTLLDLFPPNKGE